MRIAYNPKTAQALVSAPDNEDITFDLSGLAIYVKGVKFEGKVYSVFKKHTLNTTGGYDGLVPAPSYTETITRYLREDGTWEVPTNTTYTFASGTTGDFTVTPSGGTAQTVSIGKPATAGDADTVGGYTTEEIINFGRDISPYYSSACWLKFMTVSATSNTGGMIDFIISTAETGAVNVVDYFHFQMRPSDSLRFFIFTHLGANNDTFSDYIYAYTEDDRNYTFYIKYPTPNEWIKWGKVKIISTRDANVTFYHEYVSTPLGTTGYKPDFGGNVKSASTLTTPRKIWGQDFDGSGDVSGRLQVQDSWGIKVTNNNAENYGYFCTAGYIGDVTDGGEMQLTGRHGLIVSSFGNYIYLQEAGNVGINTTDPQAKLHVVGNTIIRKDLGGPLSDWVNLQHMGAFEVGRASNTMCLTMGVTDDDYGIIQSKGYSITSSGKLAINPLGGDVYIGGSTATGFAPKVTITHGGNVGVNTTKPNATLAVVGNFCVNRTSTDLPTNTILKMACSDGNASIDANDNDDAYCQINFNVQGKRRVEITSNDQTNFYSNVRITGGHDLELCASDAAPNDAGDIVFCNNARQELGRLWLDPAEPIHFRVRTDPSGYGYVLLHSGIAYINNGTVTINGTSITPLTSHQSLVNYVTLNTALTITGEKTFASNTFRLSGVEHSDIKHSSQLAYNWGGYGGTNSTPNYTGMYNSLDFQWYGDTWSIGNLRSSGSTTNGFGIGLKKNNNNGDLYFAPAFRITETESYINNNKIWHSGNDGSGSGLDADLLDGYHESSFLRYRDLGSNGGATLWSQIGIRSYHGALPEGLSGIYNFGEVVSLPGSGSRLDIFTNHVGSSESGGLGGLWWRSGWNDDKKSWRRIIDSGNIASLSVNYASSAGSASNADMIDGYHESDFFRYRGALYQKHNYDANVLGIGEYAFRGSAYGSVGTGNNHVNALSENSTILVFKWLQLSTSAWSDNVAYRVNWTGESNSNRPNGWSPWIYFLSTVNSSVSGGGSSGGSSITVNIGGTSKTLTIPTSLPANGGNADTLDNLHATSFGIWRGVITTEPTASDVTSTSTADFLSRLHTTGGLFNSAFSAMRGSWWYDGNTQLNTGVGQLDMAGTAVLNISGNTSNNVNYKSLLFLTAYGDLYSYASEESGVATWSRYSKEGHSHRVTKLHRSDASDDYYLRHYWTGSYWYLQGYYGSSYHAGVQVAYANSAGNADTVDSLHASDFVRAIGTLGYGNSYDSDWGLCMVTFDPIVSGTAAESNPNVTILNLGNDYSRRKQLWFNYDNNNIYYRRKVGSSWSSWVRLALASEIPTNTWRGITDSYSGTDTTISLSQKGANTLYNALVNGYASSAGNADTLDGYHYNGLPYIPTSGGSASGTISACNSAATNPGNAAFEAREYLRAGTDTSIAPHSVMYAPRIGFHWGNRYWANLIYYDHAFRFMDNDGDSYQNVCASGFIHTTYWSSAYALTSDGGVAHIGSMSVNYANSAGNTDTVDGYHIWVGSSSSLPANKTNNTIYITI